MNKKLVDNLNEQTAYELYSAYIYVAMAAYFDSVNLPGFAHWMKVQAKEETGHAMKFYEYIVDRGEKVVLGPIAKPHDSFSSPQDAFTKALGHEQKVTARINALYEEAKKVKDTATEIMLQWFISEQVEEEKNATAIIAQLDMIKANAPALLMLEQVLAKRGAE